MYVHYYIGIHIADCAGSYYWISDNPNYNGLINPSECVWMVPGTVDPMED